jgi:hypothetical protein
MYTHDPYRPLNRNKYVLIVVLAALTSGAVILAMVFHPGHPPVVPREPVADAPRCAAGQTTGCVGGMATVISQPASAAPAPAP